MTVKENKLSLESLLGSWIDGTINERERLLLLGLTGNDPRLDQWLERTINNQPSEIDPAISQRMLKKIHKAINNQKKGADTSPPL